jgi:hypothetical protein
MSRVEDAQMRLYEDADLRDELTDDEAEKLLHWAESELARLDAAAPDDESFEAQVDTLMKLLKQMNRYAGRQGQGFAAQSLAAQGATEAPSKIAALASELGHASDEAHVAAAATGNPATTIDALTSLMNHQPDQPPAPNSTTNTVMNDPPAPSGAQIYTWETNADVNDDSTPSDEA